MTVSLVGGSNGMLISREMRVECGPLDGRVRALFDFDVDVAREGLRALLEHPDLTGQLRITSAEHGEFRATRDVERGRGRLTIVVATVQAMQDGGGTLMLTTDQRYLQHALRALDQLPK
ncbi:MAG: hypothetical protein ACXU9O_16235 [Gemmatimonadaceae bacterium]